jgi:GNAT superfamily N-acetyltransferase
MSIERLNKSKHDRYSFFCGNSFIDEYLKKRAHQDLKRSLAVPYVLCEDGRSIIGFYTLSAISIDVGSLPRDIAKQLPRYPSIPATLIGRLGVDERYQGRSFGKRLLFDALYRSYKQADSIAAAAVVVDVKDENARAFYGRYDFLNFPDHPERMFLEMRMIRKMFGF